jgi:hypothetical protein
MRNKLPSYFYNVLTLIGATLSAVSFGLILFLILLELSSEQSKPYMGIIAFVILPGILIVGVVIAIFGIIRTRRKQRAGAAPIPPLDLTKPHHRRVFFSALVGTVGFLLFSAFGSYKAYEHTDSDQFCGEMCHKVMEPEYTAYEYSPHARVGCVKCHIGPGASWFVRAKISGTYQVYAVTFNKYPKPIPTPIENLRPAQETCEQCHWPKQFFSEKLLTNTYFISNEQNTKWTLNLLMKIGGGNIEAGPTSGIHWHMNINNEVTYASLDRERQIIPWVQSKKPDGTVTTYRSTEFSVSDDSLKKASVRRMDCIDCHNRPTHIYNPPARSVDHVMSLGWIDPKLPDIKSVAVKALEYPYDTKSVGLDSIRTVIQDFYAQNHPDIAVAEKIKIDSAIDQAQTIYRRNYFPEMGVSWKEFPDNLGHLYFKGCFRCHDGKHVSDDGKVLSRDCNTCHTILAQQFEQDTLRLSLGGIDYKHPVDIGDAWKEMNCSDCHNPGQ